MSAARDYGARARVGVAVPFSNPTVEPELRALLPAGVEVYATRLTHPAPRVEERLDWYVRHMPDAIATFGVMGIAAFGFGCTGSSYLAGAALETRLADEAAQATGVPVVTAAGAIRAALAALRRVDCAGAEVVVASGTGMPTLRALRTLAGELGVPVLCSNLCLAWALLRAAAPERAPAAPPALLG